MFSVSAMTTLVARAANSLTVTGTCDRNWLSTINTWKVTEFVVALVPVPDGSKFSHTADHARTVPPNLRTNCGARLEMTRTG